MHVRKCACALDHQSQFVVKPGVPLGDVVVEVSLLAELHHHPEGAVVVVEVNNQQGRWRYACAGGDQEIRATSASPEHRQVARLPLP